MNRKTNLQRRGRSHSHDVKIGPANRGKKGRNRAKAAQQSAQGKHEVQIRRPGRYGY